MFVIRLIVPGVGLAELEDKKVRITVLGSRAGVRSDI